MPVKKRDHPLKRSILYPTFHRHRGRGDRPSPSAPFVSEISALHASGEPIGQEVFERISSRNLDLCLLAVCSCILSLLCHQPAGIHSAQAATLPTTGTTPSAAPVRVDFLIKAGLVTHQKQDLDVVDDE